MEQPLTLKSSQPKETPTNTAAAATTNNNSTKMKRPPLRTPAEVLAHYESQGLDSRAASLKAISDLQTLILRSATARAKEERLLVHKIDFANTRLATLEIKLDSKPCLPESIAIGVATGAIVRSIASAIPHLASIWDSVKSATKTFR